MKGLAPHVGHDHTLRTLEDKPLAAWMALATVLACAPNEGVNGLDERVDASNDVRPSSSMAGAGGDFGSAPSGSAGVGRDDASTGVSPLDDAGLGDRPDGHVIRRDAGPNPYLGISPVAGTPVPLGNTKIFDDSTGVVWNQAAGELLFSVD